MENVSVDIHDRRKILQQMIDYSAFGNDDKLANINWLVEDLNILIRELGLQGSVEYLHEISHSDLSHLSGPH
jgi:hypothetical protein